MQITQQLKFAAFMLAVAVCIAAVLIYLKPPMPVQGSVPIGGEYQGTTTVSASGVYPPISVLKTGNGTLGSVVFTATGGAGTISFYDATTSSVALRAPSMSTSSILLAQFDASAPAGTYTFDRVFFNGLLVVASSPVSTTTILYR